MPCGLLTRQIPQGFIFFMARTALKKMTLYPWEFISRLDTCDFQIHVLRDQIETLRARDFLVLCFVNLPHPAFKLRLFHVFPLTGSLQMCSKSYC